VQVGGVGEELVGDVLGAFCEVVEWERGGEGYFVLRGDGCEAMEGGGGGGGF